MTMTVEGRDARVRLDAHAQGIDEVFRRYGAVNPRLFGSVACGEATSENDIDVLVDLVPGQGNDLLRIAGLTEELGGLLGCRVDVVTASILRHGIAETALMRCRCESVGRAAAQRHFCEHRQVAVSTRRTSVTNSSASAQCRHPRVLPH